MTEKAIGDVLGRPSHVLIFINLLAGYPVMAQRGNIIKPSTLTAATSMGMDLPPKSLPGYNKVAKL